MNATDSHREAVVSLIQAVEHKTRKADALVLLDWFEDITGMPPVVWHSSIVGYGRYNYQYDSGHSGESMITGFSPRKASMSVYIMPGYDDLEPQLSRLGKHKVGKSCLYINKLADINMQVLGEMISAGVDTMKQRYDTWDV
ncbi:MAG: DUF1801 domain-containing protein [Granulosicoccus sp.]